MNELIIYAAIIVVAMFLAKMIADKLFGFLAKAFGAISKSSGQVSIFLGLILIVLAYLYPTEAAQLYEKLKIFLNELL